MHPYTSTPTFTGPVGVRSVALYVSTDFWSNVLYLQVTSVIPKEEIPKTGRRVANLLILTNGKKSFLVPLSQTYTVSFSMME